jgi:hypothetical protein
VLNKLVNKGDLTTLNRPGLINAVNNLEEQVGNLAQSVQNSQEQLNALGLLAVDEHSAPGTGTGMVVCFGYQGEAEEALNRLTQKLINLQQMVRSLNVSILHSQVGDGKVDGTSQEQGMLTCMYQAIIGGAEKEAEATRQERTKAWAGAAGSLVGAGTTVGLSLQTNRSLSAEGGPTDGLSKLGSLEQAFERSPPAEVIQGEGPAGVQELTEVQSARLARIVERPTSYEPEEGDSDLFQHVQGNDELRQKLRGGVSEAKNTLTTRENTAWNQNQSRTQIWGQVVQGVQGSVSGVADGNSATAKAEKGRLDATNQAATYAQQQATAASTAETQGAQELDRAATTTNNTKNNVRSQNGN